MKNKITVPQVCEMQRLYQLGWSKAELARLYGVTIVAIKYHVDHCTRYTPESILAAVKPTEDMLRLQEAA